MAEKNTVYFNVMCYVEGKPKKIGYAYETSKGKLCIRGDKFMRSAVLGEHMKKGIYVEARASGYKRSIGE